MFVPCKPFQPNLMFAGKVRAYLSGAPFRCSTQGQAKQIKNGLAYGINKCQSVTKTYTCGLCYKHILIVNQSGAFEVLHQGQAKQIKNGLAYFDRL